MYFDCIFLSLPWHAFFVIEVFYSFSLVDIMQKYRSHKYYRADSCISTIGSQDQETDEFPDPDFHSLALEFITWQSTFEKKPFLPWF